MKAFAAMMFKTLILRNSSTIKIVSNIFVLFLSLYYYELGDLFVILFVTGSFIISNIFSLKKSIQNRMFSFYPFLMENNLKEILVVIGLFLYSSSRSFVFIQVLLGIQYVTTHNIQLVSETLTNNIISIIVYGFLTISFIVYGISRHYDTIRSYTMNDHVLYHIQKYKLDSAKTYFFSKQNSIIGFVVGDYKFDLYTGLKVGEHNYKFSLILDYLNAAGIGFHDLDDWHIQNIEMYGIS